MLSPPQVAQILHTVGGAFQLLPAAEITMEGNPGTLTRNTLLGFQNAGINRLSLGVQTTNPLELTLLGRIHSHAHTIHSIHLARVCGFDNLNLDLIYGLPAQSMETWRRTLEQIIDLNPTHLSLYALKLEEGTLLEQRITAGDFPEPDPDLAADMYEIASAFLGKHNFTQYEISNWALAAADRKYQSRHNRQYWENRPYFGFGAGAHALLEEQRLVNEPELLSYIHACENEFPHQFPLGPAVIEAIARTPSEAMDDQMIMGLRLTDEGVSISGFFSRFGISLEDRYHLEIDTLLKIGLVEYTDNKQAIRLTPRGRLLGNQVFYRFLKD